MEMVEQERRRKACLRTMPDDKNLNHSKCGWRNRSPPDPLSTAGARDPVLVEMNGRRRVHLERGKRKWAGKKKKKKRGQHKWIKIYMQVIYCT